ncbi:hypothetical protein Mh1964_06980 [Mannheimia haemolytica]
MKFNDLAFLINDRRGKQMKKSNLEAKFYEVINIDCNHRYVAGSIRLGKTNAQLQITEWRERYPRAYCRR